MSALLAKKLVHKGCDAYLVYILDTNINSVALQNIRVMKEFPDVFLEELHNLPLEHEFEFGIELFLGTTPVSITPYRMVPKEIKAQ